MFKRCGQHVAPNKSPMHSVNHKQPSIIAMVAEKQMHTFTVSRQIESRISELQEVVQQIDHKRNAIEAAYVSTVEEIHRSVIFRTC